jgi:hypothetical protein
VNKTSAYRNHYNIGREARLAAEAERKRALALPLGTPGRELTIARAGRKMKACDYTIAKWRKLLAKSV